MSNARRHVFIPMILGLSVILGQILAAAPPTRSRFQNLPPTAPAAITLPDEPDALIDNRLGTVIQHLQQLPFNSQRSTTIILADEIDIGDCNFDPLQSPINRHLIMVADRIKISGYCQMHLGRIPYSPQFLPPHLTAAFTLLAHTLIIEEKGALCFIGCTLFSSPPGRTPPPYTDLPVNVTIAAENVDGTAKAGFWHGVFRDPSVISSINSESGAFSGFFTDGIFAAPGSSNSGWKQPFLQELQLRPLTKPIDASDLDFTDRAISAWFANESRIAGLASLFALLLTGNGPDGRPTSMMKIMLPGNNFDRLADAAGSDPAAGLALSLWATESMRSLQTNIYDALRTEDRLGLLSSFKRYTAFPSYPLISRYQNPYQQLIANINQLRETFTKHLWRRSISVDLAGLPSRDVDVFTEGTALEGKLPATVALLTERVVQNRTVLGTAQFETIGGTQELVLSFDAELSVDPLVADAISKKLATLKEQYTGTFANWDLHARPIIAEGIKSSDVTQTGSLLHVTLHLDPDTGPLALWRLSSDAGLPITFDYEYHNDPQQKGTLSGISLSLSRRQKPSLTVGSSGVKNTGQVAVTIAYFETPSSELRPLLPALTIGPNQTQDLPQLNGIDPTTIRVPPQAVSTAGGDPFSLNDFFNIGDVQFIDTITVKNALPSVDPEKNRLLYIELTVSYTSGTGADARPQAFGPIHLLAQPSEGSEKKIPFFQFQQRTRHVQLSGKAVYENGFQDFTFTSADKNIEIRPESIR